MSEANVELVRAVYSAWERGESAEDLIAEDVEYVNPPYAVEPGTRRGRATFGRVGDAYDDIRVRPHRFVDVGDDVVVLATVTARSRGAGVPVHREHGYIWTVRDGQAIRFRWFRTAAEALEAVGLPARPAPSA